MAQAQLPTHTSERLRELPRSLDAQLEFREAVSALSAGQDVSFDGVWGSSCALLAAGLRQQVSSTILVVLPRAADVDPWMDDLDLFCSTDVCEFPAWEGDPGERFLHDETYAERLRTLKQLLSHPPDVIVTSIQSLVQPVPSQAGLAKHSRSWRVGDRIDVDELSHWLAGHRFHSTTAVELPGEFSTRGGIMDIFAPDWDAPTRIELFDDEIESIRTFDIATQRSVEHLQQIELTVIPPSSADQSSLIDYLDRGSRCLLVEPEQVREEGKRFLELCDDPQSLHSVATIERQLFALGVATASEISAGKAAVSCALRVESVDRFSGEFGRVRQELDQIGAGHDAYIVARTDAEITRLSEILEETELWKAGRVQFVVGNLREGFRIPDAEIIVISSPELFDRGQVRRIPRRRLGKAIDSFMDLKEGDLVVHLAHGIGRFRGLQLIEKDDHIEEHLVVEFHGSTKLYVPATKIGLVQKYIGGGKTRPTLAKLGGKSWVRQRHAAETAVMDLAAEMLELQAGRQARPGIEFAPDSDWQHEFDASFPYTETPDQNAAIGDIKRDMERSRPMDRLLCGDVGYGKTEIAMRAAFKAVDNGHQVAILVPTTILAEQHYHTLKARMSEFPFDIAKLSRFCTAADQREVVEGLRTGRIDIVVGTHRLASKDVSFYNLGLVVIDEEQRFGVEVKERLKSLRSVVDVMTLSATPIPRTLHMSLVGVRDISNLETPPEDRLSVETKVTRFDDELIRRAVLRELNRGGQIFFVHNRVHDIEIVAKRLQHIVPEATVGIGHGQMPETQLEKVMVGFVNHEFDMLLATTIVESGLDIPNANTIFIDEADRYGLADLHQLRGRVGRFKNRAFCYLLVDPHKSITPNAARRLRAIEEYSDMGAGFAISMRDLEIRGAGNLLGTQQSGHIAAVGYEHYCQLLETAVRKLQQLPPQRSVEVEIDLPGRSYLPSDYCEDQRSKIDLYRRIGRISDVSQIEQLREEMQDRFGALPEPARRLLALAEIRIDASIWLIRSIHLEPPYLVFGYADAERIEQLARRKTGQLRIADGKQAYLPISDLDGSDEILEFVKSVLIVE